MKTRSKLVFTFLILLAGAAHAQSPIGRVLLASGDTQLIRGGAAEATANDAPLFVGDSIRTGAAGFAQLWFNDSSVVAMRSNSEFTVAQFEFNGSTGSAALSLIRGGLRTVTGLLARNNPRGYSLKTKVTIVGIRGTEYSLLLCDDDCNNEDGTRAANGLYGGVYAGAVVLTNNTPEREFGREEYFYVADQNSVPQPLLAPPSFLADRLVGVKRVSGQALAASVPNAPTDAEESTPAVSVDPYTAPTNLSGGNSAVLPPPRSVLLLYGAGYLRPNGGTDRYNAFGRFGGTAGGTYALSGFGSTQILSGFDAASFLSGVRATIGSGGATEVGFNAEADAHWGRWVDGRIFNDSVGSSQIPQGGLHYLYGTLTAQSVLAAKTGTFAFNDIGGTTPTDSNGALATSFAFGPINVNFTSRTGTVTSVSAAFTNAVWNFANIGFTFQPNQPGGASAAYVPSNGSGTCVGTACGGGATATLRVTPYFLGSQGNFLGSLFSATTGSTPSGNSVFNAVRIFAGSPSPPPGP